MFRTRNLALLLCLLLPAACSKRADRVEVSPKKVKIFGLDRPQRLTARILDKRGLPLEIGTPNWESSKTAVATVDNAGLVTPKTEGSTLITARYNSVFASVPVEVVDVKSVEVTPPALHVVGPPGTTIPIRAVVKNSKNKVIGLVPAWTSSKPAIATVSPAGVVTTVSKGAGRLAHRHPSRHGARPGRGLAGLHGPGVRRGRPSHRGRGGRLLVLRPGGRDGRRRRARVRNLGGGRHDPRHDRESQRRVDPHRELRRGSAPPG